ncbi:MAG TPA: molybdate ABC transporter substrate-binding protein [Candidatus Blautia stercoripullorum]|uniref:Molybdate ABC transporter substrate-binding protein n=1 Tax=Candidatus Blautia stercoripullorum TaxID=2838502 RepID=A0A9D2R7C8_9FIRM|nr:molybdate ABC transporter substrate-binding protein [Candidatus Blautia stercoripullorum]
MRKKVLAVLLAGTMALAMGACGQGNGTETSGTGESSSGETDSTETDSETGETADEGEEVELTVFAAASLTETLTDISELYKEEHPEVSLVFNFDSSGTLKTQIQEGAVCDLFISAGQTQMDQMDSTADPSVNTEGLDLVLEDSRIDILENKVVLCVSDSSVPLETFDDMAAALKEGTILLGMGNSDVPVGQYTRKILEYYGLDEEKLAADGLISYGSNVKEVTTQVSEGAVDCGVIYCTDAYSAGLTASDYATPEMCGQVIYPAAVMKNSRHPEEAQAFLDFLQTDPCMEIFEQVGFSRVEEG